MKISQTEARRYRAEANKLRETLRKIHATWGQEFVDGVCIGNLQMDPATKVRIQTAGTLKHAVVVTYYGDTLYFHAMPAPETSP